MSTKVKQKSVKRRMNALLQLAILKAVNEHSYERPDVAQCYKTDETYGYFFFTSESGAEVGEGEQTVRIPIGWTNTAIIQALIADIREVTGYAEHQYRKQIRQAAMKALAARPADGRAILSGMISLVQTW